MSARRPYHRQVTGRWWLRNPFFVRYMVREASSVFVLGYSLVLLRGLWALRAGPDAYAAYLAALQSPWAIAVHGVALLMVGYHTVTFLSMTPRTMRLEWRGRKLADRTIVVAEYAALAAVCGLVAAGFGVL
ncbi:MAG: fumarate reductase subunit C [Gammaproteobacteria bacterium]|jgi:fumarate reductase subunit C|nr:fumarate reductase subunit C [Gammaproteobacteria bacterium]